MDLANQWKPCYWLLQQVLISNLYMKGWLICVCPIEVHLQKKDYCYFYISILSLISSSHYSLGLFKISNLFTTEILNRLVSKCFSTKVQFIHTVRVFSIYNGPFLQQIRWPDIYSSNYNKLCRINEGPSSPFLWQPIILFTLELCSLVNKLTWGWHRISQTYLWTWPHCSILYMPSFWTF